MTIKIKSKFIILSFLLSFINITQAQTQTQTMALPELTEIIEKNTPAIVNISTSHSYSNYKKLIKLPPELEGTPQGELLRRFFEEQDDSQNKDETLSLGSGTLVSKDGYIVTNQHVINNADRIIVKLADKREYPAKLVGSDTSTDLALIKINANDLPYVALGDSDKLKVGEWVVAIGSPFGFEHSATAGIISGKGRSIGKERFVPFLQTDAAINPGNSGGPLFDMSGNVIGINSQILSKSGGYQGLSFAIPSNVLRNVISQLKDVGFVSHGWLGVAFQEMNSELAKSFNLDRAYGALIASIVDDSPATRAGLKVGDIILKLNDETILNATQLPAIVGNTKPGTVVKLTVFRSGKTQDVNITIGQLEQDEIKKADGYKNKEQKSADETKYDRLGLKTRELIESERAKFGIPKGGVYISKVDSAGIAENLGLTEGLVILTLDMKDVMDVKGYEAIVKSLSPDKWVSILVKNDSGSKRYFAFKITK
ncbi:MAG: Do family serine endopeptidase [Gammaproteobacteria bacterium]|nr:Do family serine endopeptidase [Gammaproteobacteria bacterium]